MVQKFGHFPLLLKPHPQRGQITLLICRIVLEKLQALGKQFHWKKPECCPECGSIRLWGHGFVLRQFVGFAQGLWMKRYRCPDCHAVHTCRPKQIPARDAIPYSNSEIQPGSKACRNAVSSSCAPADPAALVEGISRSLPGGRQLE
jgi:hypothetical protein